MFRIAFIGLVLLGVGLSIGKTAGGNAVAEETRKLQGRWSVVESVDSGFKTPDEELKRRRIVIEGDRITLHIGNDKHEASFKIDPSKRMKEIDLTATTGIEKGEVVLGIYALEGDQLKLCIDSNPDSRRPSEFKSNKGSELVLYVLKRHRP